LLTGPRIVLFVYVVTYQYLDAPIRQVPDGFLDGRKANLCPVGKRHGYYGLTFTNCFDEEAEREGIRDSGSPLCQGVAGYWSYDHRIRRREFVGRVRLFVFASDRVTGL
jgi:hypothetical protein